MMDLTHLDLSFLPDDPEGIYLVGGTVRDLLAGRRPADIDLVVAGDVDGAARRIAEKTGGKVISIGKKGFDVLRVAGPGLTVDLSPLIQSSIEADLLQRDFTINAMAYDLKRRRLVDCTGGLADMQRRRVRMVSPAVFKKDPARLVRAYRIATTFHFSITAQTREAIGSDRHLVAGVAGERLWSDLFKLFSSADSAAGVEEMAADGLLTSLFPELQPAVGCVQNRHHRLDVFDHTLRVYGCLERLLAEWDSLRAHPGTDGPPLDLSGDAAILKYAALLHDVGKPATRRVDPHGRIHFYGHAAKSADIAAGVSDRLKLSNRQRRFSDAVIRHHLRPLFLFISSENGHLGNRGMVRFFNRCGHLTLPIIVHTMADIMAKGEVLREKDARFIDFAHRLIQAYAEFKRRRSDIAPLIDGNDLIALFDLPPSPRFKSILKQVDERRLCGELTSRDQAIGWVRAYLASEAENRRREQRSEDRGRKSENG